MIDISFLFPTWESRLVASILAAAGTVGLVYLVRRARRMGVKRWHPVVVDLVSAIALVGIVLGATLLIAEIWGETHTLVEQLGILRLDGRAPELTITLVVVIAVQVFAGIAARLLEDLTTESDALTPHQREVSLRITQLVLWTAALILILGVWDVDLTGLLVGAGFLGIVIGLAAQKTVGSLLAGFVLMFSRPFEVGDWILIDEHEGVVSDITLMSTRLRTFDGEYIVVPNDVVGGKTVVNRSRYDRLRASVEVGIDYNADIERARDLAQEVTDGLITSDPAVLASPSPDVLVRRLDDSAVVIEARVWVDRPNSGELARVRDTLMCELKGTFDDAGIKIPFPQRELSGREDAGELGGFAHAPEDGERTSAPDSS